MEVRDRWKLLGYGKRDESIMVSFNFIGIFRPRCDLNMQFSELLIHNSHTFSILNHEHIEWSACVLSTEDVEIEWFQTLKD